MLRSLCLLTVSGLFLAAAPAPAEDTYAIKTKDSARGDIDLVSEDTTEELAMTVKDADGKVVNEVKEKETVMSQYREELLEKEAKKKASRLRRTYEKAQVVVQGETKTLPYQGKTVLIEKKDGKFHFMIEGGKEITGEDAKYLTKEFDKKDDTESDLEKLLLPKKAVALGESWKPDLEGVAKDIGREGELELDATKATGSGKLLKVSKKDGHQFGEMAFQLDLPLKAFSAGDQKVVMAPGSKMVIDLKADGCIDGSLRDGKMEGKFQLTGEGTLSAGGMDFKVTMNISVTGKKSSLEVKK